MGRIGLGIAVALSAFALVSCVSIQPRPTPTPFRGEFPQLVDVQYDPGYGDPYGPPPPYAGEPDYGYDPGYDERGYAAEQDYHWYSAQGYRAESRDERRHEKRDYREHAPRHESFEYEYHEQAPRREYAPEHHSYEKSHSEYREHASSHVSRYTYKYRIRTRVIKLDRLHLKKVESYGAARPVPYAYSYAEYAHYEAPKAKIYKKVVRKKMKVRKKRPAKTCTCTLERRVEDIRTRVDDSRVKVERFGDGYKVAMPAEILFALDSDAVKPEANAIIRRVASGLMGERGAEIDVNGYTDTSGSDEHNDLLSQSRAVAVADALVREGVDAEALNPRGFGESVLAVGTPDGVREPLNRRVEILVMPAQS